MEEITAVTIEYGNNASLTVRPGSDSLILSDSASGFEVVCHEGGPYLQRHNDGKANWAIMPRPEETGDDFPDWDEAPDWANFRGVNKHGLLGYFENNPGFDDNGLFNTTDLGPFDKYLYEPGCLKDSLRGTMERRPVSFEPPWDKVDTVFDQYATFVKYGRTMGRFWCTGPADSHFDWTCDDPWTEQDILNKVGPDHEWQRP